MKKHALLIGVEDYREDIPEVKYARADALEMGNRLRERCGFDQVHVLADESGKDEPLRVNIVKALREISMGLGPEDLFLFFFAGHGMEERGKSYLFTSDSLAGHPEEGGLSLRLLQDIFGSMRVGKRILLLDTCRNSPEIARSDTPNVMGKSIFQEIKEAAKQTAGSVTITGLLSACRSGQRAYGYKLKGHGVFTHYLLEGIDRAAWRDEELEFNRLAEYAATRVREWASSRPGLQTAQEPWYEMFGTGNRLCLVDAPKKQFRSINAQNTFMWEKLQGEELQGEEPAISQAVSRELSEQIRKEVRKGGADLMRDQKRKCRDSQEDAGKPKDEEAGGE